MSQFGKVDVVNPCACLVCPNRKWRGGGDTRGPVRYPAACAGRSIPKPVLVQTASSRTPKYVGNVLCSSRGRLERRVINVEGGGNLD
jgi:hypothetical protein